MDLHRIYHYALQREHEGKRFFEENANRMSHPAASRAFQVLVGEEQRHIDFIKHLLEALDGGQLLPPDAPPDLIESKYVGFFDQRLESEAVDDSVAESMVPDLPILRMAYLIERDFAEFYELAASHVEGQAQHALAMLANWERGHERLFKQMHDQAFEDYAQMPWGG
jgi:rubrerythrin